MHASDERGRVIKGASRGSVYGKNSTAWKRGRVNEGRSNGNNVKCVRKCKCVCTGED